MRNNTFSVLMLTLPLFLIGCNDGSKSKTPTDPVTGTQQNTENVAPVANAGPAQSILIGTEVKLSASASTDANNDPLTYLWTLTSKPTGSNASLNDVTSATPTFTADVAGSYVATLVVNDGKLNSTAAQVTITASVGNAAPVANAGDNQNVTTGTMVTLDGSKSTDADGDPLTYLWVLTSTPTNSGAMLSDVTSASPSFTADLAGSYVATLVVNDGTLNSAIAQVTVTASVGNAAPVAKAGDNQNVTIGTVVTLDGSKSTDADGNSLTYLWTLTSKPTNSTAVLSDVTSATPSFTADLAGSYVATLVVNDGTVNSTAAQVTITASVGNAAPVANAGDNQNVTTGTMVTLDGSKSTDADGDPLTYLWVLTSKPTNSGASLSDVTSVTPTFTADLAGSYVATLVVNDGKVNSVAAQVTITASVDNAAPVANAGANQNVATGTVVKLSGSASTDANNDALTYLWTLTSKPTNSTAILSDVTSATPSFTADLAGSYVATLVVNDGKVSSTAAQVTITAIDSTGNIAPVANAGINQNVTLGSMVTLDGSLSSDANNDSLTYKWTISYKPETSTATLADATTVAPTFMADKVGSYVFALIVNDGIVDSKSSYVVISVK